MQRLALLTLSAGLLACSEGSTTLAPEAPKAASPAAIAIVSGDHQVVMAGEALAEPLVVRVTDAQGNPVPAVPVSWSVASGGGTLSYPGGSTVPFPTDRSGLNQAFFAAGGVGTSTVTASVAGLQGPPATFTVETTLQVAPLLILADLSPQSQGVHVFRARRAVNNAVVRVNGVAIPYGPDMMGDGGYWGKVRLTESRFHLEVSHGGETVEATGHVPEAPVLTAPATRTVFTLADSITFAWTSATDPDGFEVWFGFRRSCCGSFAAPGSARELKIAASQMGTNFGTDVIGVFAINEGSFTGPADLESYMNIRSPGIPPDPDTEITIAP